MSLSDRRHVVMTATTLDEIARAIGGLSFRRVIGELAWPHLEPEMKVLKTLLQQRVALIKNLSADQFYDLAAVFILDAMVAQHLHDLRLAAQFQPPFDRGKAP
jgi:hypothetical protein